MQLTWMIDSSLQVRNEAICYQDLCIVELSVKLLTVNFLRL